MLFLYFIVDFYADAVPFVDRAPQDIPEMDDPRPLPCADSDVEEDDNEIRFTVLAGASQKGKVTSTINKLYQAVNYTTLYICILILLYNYIIYDIYLFCRIYCTTLWGMCTQ